MSDPVNNPKHYNVAGIEAIDIIESALGPAGFKAFCVGNVIKYRWRAADKGGDEDVRKARVYAEWANAGTAKGRRAAPPHAAIDIEHPSTPSAARVAQQTEVAESGSELNNANGPIAE